MGRELQNSFGDWEISSLISKRTVLVHYRLLEEQPKTRYKF